MRLARTPRIAGSASKKYTRYSLLLRRRRSDHQDQPVKRRTENRVGHWSLPRAKRGPRRKSVGFPIDLHFLDLPVRTSSLFRANANSRSREFAVDVRATIERIHDEITQLMFQLLMQQCGPGGNQDVHLVDVKRLEFFDGRADRRLPKRRARQPETRNEKPETMFTRQSHTSAAVAPQISTS